MRLTRFLLLIATIFTSLFSFASGPGITSPTDSVSKGHKADTAGHALLVRKWVCIDVKDPEVDIAKFTKEQREMLKESLQKITLDFKSNGVLLSSTAGKEDAGTWELSYKTKTLAMISDTGVRDECTLTKLSATTLTLKKDNTILSFAPVK